MLFYLNSLMMSFPLANHFIEQERHVAAVQGRDGQMFMKARMMERKAVMNQKVVQSHAVGNTCPMEANRRGSAPSFAEHRLNCFT